MLLREWCNENPQERNQKDHAYYYDYLKNKVSYFLTPEALLGLKEFFEKCEEQLPPEKKAHLTPEYFQTLGIYRVSFLKSLLIAVVMDEEGNRKNNGIVFVYCAAKPNIYCLFPMKKIVTFGNFVKFSHTIFALPFVLATIAIVSLEIDLKVWQVVLVIAAMATARSAAMGINRIIDRDIDAKNLRTKNRELITGKVSLRSARMFVIVNSLLFLGIASTFNRITTMCAPFVLILFFLYPFLKRFTWLSHLFLGFVDGLAPTATWIALTGTIALPAIFLSFAMMFWIAGFDILYSLLDIEFDRHAKLFSIPAYFGIKEALVLSAIFHALTLIFLAFALKGTLYFLGLLILLVVLVYEHWIVKPNDLSRVNAAFFNVNGLVSIIYFLFTWLQVAMT